MTRSPEHPIARYPASLGYRMPAEWEPHSATWLAWPHNRTDWPGKFEAIPWVYAEIVRHLARVERVHLLVNDAAHQRRAQEVLRRSSVPLDQLDFHRFPTNRGWTRDSCPIFLLSRDPRDRRRLALAKWRFNAWAKYPDWRKDEAAARRIVRAMKVPSWFPSAEVAGKRRPVVLEGGSIDVNGRGLLLTTEECQLSSTQQRNPGLGRSDLERVFADYLGIGKVLWLERGIMGDDTHGHVDDIARFVSPDTVVAAVERNRNDENYAPLQANLRRLRAATDQDGRRLNVVELPMPAPVVFRGQRLPASYANFYIANRLVLVPTFDDPNDRVALNLLSDLFPDRQVVGIHCGDLVWGLGALHCM
ncbi:MAG TPA: agmatine deiminase family protein, partial [Terriglobales bacterium]|nr:agmatine deiminase family protein [Terriglobales bacterium]